MSLIRWKPERQLISLPGEIDRFFTNYGLDWSLSDTAWKPQVDVSETPESYEFKAELPGLKKEEIKIEFHDHVLTLSGERKWESEQEKKNYHRVERVYGKFERSFRLPQGTRSESIKANYRDGILTIEVPKPETVKPKEIAVN